MFRLRMIVSEFCLPKMSPYHRPQGSFCGCFFDVGDVGVDVDAVDLAVALDGDVILGAAGETADALTDREGIIFCGIGDEAARLRSSFPALKDRRTALYRKWME